MLTPNLSKSVLILFGLSVLAGCSVSNSDNSSLVEGAQADQTAFAIDGSSTVYPITEEVAQRLRFEQPDGPEITVNFSGTGGGFKKFCAGTTQINGASRPIKQSEMETCKAAGVKYIELPVAFDALTVVTHGDNDWAQDITLAELKKVWEPGAEGKVSRWNQIRSDWPDEPITLYGPGEDSGTFDYFTEVVTGDSGESRKDYSASEDDYELVKGVSEDPNSLGYFGYAYYQEGKKILNALAINSGSGPVEPSRETVRDGSYQPLARPLFIYVNAEAAEQNPELKAFVEYYLSNARGWVRAVGYEPLPDEAYALALERLEQGKLGSMFDGGSQPGLTIEELLQKEAES